jgi:hypothetical protein
VTRPIPAPPAAPTIRAIAKTAAVPFILGVVSAALCIVAAGGDPLGAWIGSIALATLSIPPFASSARDRWSAFFVAGAAIDGVALALLACVFAGRMTFIQFLACYSVLAAYGLALMTLARTIRMPLTIVLAFAWLTWPLWLTPLISGPVAAWLTPAHPLLAINHVLLDHGVWTQQRLMYQYTRLGQDVPYTLPQTIWPCVILHLLVALPILWWKERGERKERGPLQESSPASPAPTSEAGESSRRPD